MNARYITFLLALTLYACSGDDGERVFTPADSGADAGADQQASSDAGDAATSEDAAGGDDATADAANDAGADAPTTTGCVLNADGIIERSEITLQAGLGAKFETATDVVFDTAGTEVGGVRTWDLAQQFAGDETIYMELGDPADQWWSNSFPTATYFVPLSSTSDLLGVFEATDSALLLVGVVSPDDGAFKTELAYDPAVPVLQFPLRVGDNWEVDTQVSGFAQGVFVIYDETHRYVVDAEGSLSTPFATMDVLRVQNFLERTVGLLVTVTRSFGFVSECLGTVALINSQENENETEFTDVAEVRRLGL